MSALSSNALAQRVRTSSVTIGVARSHGRSRCDTRAPLGPRDPQRRASGAIRTPHFPKATHWVPHGEADFGESAAGRVPLRLAPPPQDRRDLEVLSLLLRLLLRRE